MANAASAAASHGIKCPAVAQRLTRPKESEPGMRSAIWIGLLLLFLVAGPLLLRFRPRWAARFNLAVTNRITSRFATRLPGFGMLIHVGRKSGRLYRTPVNVFRAPDGFLIALTYGRDSQWVKNVLAAGSCQLETRGVRYRLSAPTIVHDPTRRHFPFLVRTIFRIVGANDFIRLSPS